MTGSANSPTRSSLRIAPAQWQGSSLTSPAAPSSTSEEGSEMAGHVQVGGVRTLVAQRFGLRISLRGIGRSETRRITSA
jgi:hypothetical protein